MQRAKGAGEDEDQRREAQPECLGRETARQAPAWGTLVAFQVAASVAVHGELIVVALVHAHAGIAGLHLEELLVLASRENSLVQHLGNAIHGGGGLHLEGGRRCGEGA